MGEIHELHQAAVVLSAKEVSIVASSGLNMHDVAVERCATAARWCTARACGLSQEIVDSGAEEKTVLFSCAARCDSPEQPVHAAYDVRDVINRLRLG